MEDFDATSDVPGATRIGRTHFSIAQFMARYAMMNGGATYKTWLLNRRHELKIAAFRVPARGR